MRSTWSECVIDSAVSGEGPGVDPHVVSLDDELWRMELRTGDWVSTQGGRAVLWLTGAQAPRMWMEGKTSASFINQERFDKASFKQFRPRSQGLVLPRWVEAGVRVVTQPWSWKDRHGVTPKGIPANHEGAETFSIIHRVRHGWIITTEVSDNRLWFWSGKDFLNEFKPVKGTTRFDRIVVANSG